MDSSQPLFLLFIFFDAPSLLHLRNIFFSYSSSSSSLVVRLFQSAAFNEEKDHVIVSDILSRRGLTAERDEKDGRLYTRRVSSRIARAQFFPSVAIVIMASKKRIWNGELMKKTLLLVRSVKKKSFGCLGSKRLPHLPQKLVKLEKGV